MAEAMRVACETLVRLGHPELVKLLIIQWSGRFTSRMGDAAYWWVIPGNKTSSFPCMVSETLLREKYPDAVSDVDLPFSRRAVVVVRCRFSSALWDRATEKDRYETVVHEVCHLVADHEARLGGKRRPSAHGPEWKLLMIRAGVIPENRHSVNTQGVGHRKYPVRCGCSTHWVTKRRAESIARGGVFLCRKCGKKVAVGS